MYILSTNSKLWRYLVSGASFPQHGTKISCTNFKFTCFGPYAFNIFQPQRHVQHPPHLLIHTHLLLMLIFQHPPYWHLHTYVATSGPFPPYLQRRWVTPMPTRNGSAMYVFLIVAGRLQNHVAALHTRNLSCDWALSGKHMCTTLAHVCWCTNKMACWLASKLFPVCCATISQRLRNFHFVDNHSRYENNIWLCIDA